MAAERVEDLIREMTVQSRWEIAPVEIVIEAAPGPCHSRKGWRKEGLYPDGVLRGQQL